jgi:hypothetical protein
MPKRKRQLCAGKGARATILTRFIKPKPTEIPSKDHRSEAVLLDRFEDEKGKVCYQFLCYAFGPTFQIICCCTQIADTSRSKRKVILNICLMIMGKEKMGRLSGSTHILPL